MKIVKKKINRKLSFGSRENPLYIAWAFFRNETHEKLTTKTVLRCTPCYEAVSVSHYDNTPMQYTAIFHDCKNGNFQIKNRYFSYFLLKT